MKTVTLASGEKIPALGLGTWRMGERAGDHGSEVRALRTGLDLGLTLIDTAEMYGEGGAEEVVAEAITGRRGEVFLVSKVYPHNASKAGAIAACERSLKRLKTDRLDLYLLHWRGSIPLAETVEAFERLRNAGKIRYWGVSNFDVDDMQELLKTVAGSACAANQVLYHLGERGIEWQLLPDSRRRKIAIMAYSPLGQGRILRNRTLREVAARRGVAPAAVAVAWTLRQNNVISIPKSADEGRVRELAKARDLALEELDLAALDKAFPPPSGPSRLAFN
ncbi:MAG TPA: aldo/keto reductase [Hyphomicrobiaceae bacterium]|nr:aldo/keto reductase [Hyphomicrobiaceae bacterium]